MDLIALEIALFGIVTTVGGWLWTLARLRQQLMDARSEIEQLKPRVGDGEMKTVRLETEVEFLAKDRNLFFGQIERYQRMTDRLIGMLSETHGVDAVIDEG